MMVDRGAELGFEADEHRPAPRLYPAAQGAEQLQLHVLPHLHHVALVGDGVGAERGLAEERGHLLAVLLQALYALGTEVQGVHILARGGMGGPAVLAVPARRVREHHVVSRLDGLHALAHLLDDAGALVPEDDGIGNDAVVPGHGVRMANARSRYPHQHLAGARFRQLHFLDLERLPLAVGDGGFDPHGMLLPGRVGTAIREYANHARLFAPRTRQDAANRRQAPS